MDKKTTEEALQKTGKGLKGVVGEFKEFISKGNVLDMAVGLIVGLVAKKWKFGIVPAVITGIALSFICPAIGTPIGIYVYGGLNGSVSDMLVMSLVQGGKTIFQASFLRNVASNLIDKIGTCIIGCLLIKAMPMRFMDNFKKEA